jgi:signal transduction histidine kinase/DNA-binding response OmpR family regulator
MRHQGFLLGKAAVCLLVLQGMFVSCFQRNGGTAGKALQQANEARDSIEIVIRRLNGKGTNLRNESRYGEALQKHFEALNLAEEHGDTSGQIYALNNLGTDLRRTGSYSEASVYHYSAMELCGGDPEYRKSRAVAMNGLGNIFLALDKPEEARTYLEQSLQIEIELDSPLGKAMNYANIAKTFYMQEQLDSALHYNQLSQQENESIQSDIGTAICKKAIGEIYLKQGKTRLGLGLIKEAVNLLSDSKDAYHRAEMEISYCSALIRNGRTNEAETHLNEVLKLAHILDSHEDLYTAYGMLAELREAQRRPEEALAAGKLMMTYHDSLLAKNNEVRILELANRYKSRQAALQISLLEAEMTLTEKTKKDQKRLFFLVIFILGVLSIFLYYRERNRRLLAKELKKVNDMKTRFFTEISHEFRTPLTLIKSPVEHMIDQNKDPDIASSLNLVLRNTNHMLFLVEQLMNISKLDAGKFTIRVQLDDLAQTLRNVCDFFAASVAEKSLAYEQNIVPSGPVWFDPNIVQILMVNLLSNAIKFSPERGEVRLETRNLGEFYEFSLENDTVRDYTEDELSHMFNRFYTTAKEAYKGTGIGLALIHEVCALYHADVDMRYGNRRIRFTVKLPVNKEAFLPGPAPSEAPASPNRQADPEAADNEDKEAQIILVVEDNDDMRLFLKNILEGEYTVLTAKDGNEGIATARETVPDLIISDVLMPVSDGLHLCETLKSDVRTSHVPIILLTALNDQEDIERGLACKADDYIVKPFNAKILQAKIRNLFSFRDALVRKYREAARTGFQTIELHVRESRFATLLDGITGRITDPDFGVDEFCEACSMSRTQLHRKLKATTGLSATAYLRNRRIRIASEMLKRRDANIADACYASGFRDPSYFSKCFREEMNMTPAAYRKQFLS